MKRRAGSGALIILALFLASSGALRLGSDLGVALAEISDTPKTDTPEVLETCVEPPLALAQSLQARSAEILARETAMQDRQAALDLAEQAITARMTELKMAEEELKKTLAIADGAAEKDLTTLTAVYEAMKPADAIKVFAQMAPEFAAGFLSRMQANAAAAILSGLSPDQAYSISVLIAGRNALAPKS